MKTVTMLEFRKDARNILRRVAKGERLLLSHRGKPVARLEPVDAPQVADPAGDPFLSAARRATASPKGKTSNRDLDRILYGNR